MSKSLQALQKHHYQFWIRCRKLNWTQRLENGYALFLHRTFLFLESTLLRDVGVEFVAARFLRHSVCIVAQFNFFSNIKHVCFKRLMCLQSFCVASLGPQPLFHPLYFDVDIMITSATVIVEDCTTYDRWFGIVAWDLLYLNVYDQPVTTAFLWTVCSKRISNFEEIFTVSIFEYNWRQNLLVKRIANTVPLPSK